jgi:plastocyanin
MNNKKTIMKKPSTIIAAAAIIAVVASSVIVLGMQNKTLQNALGQSYGSSNGGSAAAAAAAAANPIAVSNNPNQSTNKEFWIKTVHLDGFANLKGIPTGPDPAPPEKFPNSTIPAGGGVKLTPPDKTGAWKFRVFTFEPSQIVVNQGDKVTLHFADVQGAHYTIAVDGIGSFPISRGQIHTVSFTADKVGIINYWSPDHMPSVVGQIVVLPRTA